VGVEIWGLDGTTIHAFAMTELWLTITLQSTHILDCGILNLSHTLQVY